MVTHNHAELAPRALAAARAAAAGIATEWLVIDCGSSDGTPAVVAQGNPDAHVLVGENVGFAAASNRALALARGRYILLLNPDAIVVEGDFANLLALLDARPEIGLASVIQRAPDGPLHHSIRHYPSARRALGEALGIWRWAPLAGWREEETRPSAYCGLRSVDWVVGAFLIARAEAVRAVGRLDERFFLYSEEIDWCYRFRRGGWHVCHLPGMTVIHHVGFEPRPELLAQLSYAKLLFARKHYRPARALAIHAALVLRHSLRALASALAGVRSRGWRARGSAELHALSVLLALAPPPFAATRPTPARELNVPPATPGGCAPRACGTRDARACGQSRC